ncbi:MAG: DUF2164 domain-containing protein [Negativicutes bacterium]|nr:DUF2164 domain-containing protein [Negativicutes bacterium]
MSKIKLTKDDRTNAVRDIQAYFLQEREEEIGNLAAEFFLDFILAKIGPSIYNQAIDDAHTLLFTQIEELYGLQKAKPR